MTDEAFPCTVDRYTGTYSTHMVSPPSPMPAQSQQLTSLLSQYMINHFLDINETLLGTTFPVPATSALLTTNAVSGSGSLGAQATACYKLAGYQPTFTLVDFYDVGNGSVFQYAAKLNGVAYVAGTIGDGSDDESSGSSSGDGSVTSTSLSGAWGVRPKVIGAGVVGLVAAVAMML